MPFSRRKRDGDTRAFPCTFGSRQASCAVRQERPSTQARQIAMGQAPSRAEPSKCSGVGLGAEVRVSGSGLRFGARGGRKKRSTESRASARSRPTASHALLPFSPFCPSRPSALLALLPFSPRPRTRTRTICDLDSRAHVHASCTRKDTPPKPRRPRHGTKDSRRGPWGGRVSRRPVRSLRPALRIIVGSAAALGKPRLRRGRCDGRGRARARGRAPPCRRHRSSAVRPRQPHGRR